MRSPSQFSLFTQRRFAPFFWTQFFGALNDNVFKTGVMTALTFDAINWTTMDRGFLNNLIPGLFILPFVLFSAFAGQLADKFEKSHFIQKIKLLEIAIMLAAAIGWMTHDLWLLIAAVAGMGLHSALFGPVKYAYLPQKLEPRELIGGNGVIEMGTFVGILLGQVLGATLVSYQQRGLELIAGGAILIAILGWLCSRKIPDSPAPVPQLPINWNLFTETARNLRFSSRNRTVFIAMLANSWFWFYGAILLAQFPVYTEAYLHGDYGIFVLLLSTFSLGVGTGSLLCERLSGRRVEIGLVPLGAMGLSLFGYDLYRASLAYSNTDTVDVISFLQQVGSVHIVFDCLMIGLVGGIYVVPLFALIQTRCDPLHMSRTIAGMNILNAIFMVAAALLAMILLKAGLSIPQLFLVTAILSALATLCIFILVPEFLLRFFAWILMHTVHRMRCVHAERIPQKGGAILVCSSVSSLDAIVMMAASPRPLRFVMDHHICKTPLLSWLFRATGAILIPIVPVNEDANPMETSTTETTHEAIRKALAIGELVCILPQGSLAANGGFMKILEHSSVPLIPMALRGQWGSLLTRRTPSPASSLAPTMEKHRLFSRLQLIVGQPIPVEEVTPDSLHERVQTLRGE